MDPGMAFGTGSHETTQLCLELIEKVKPDELLDIGTGSGILAIAAAKMGAKNITAVDIDPDAVRTAKENVRLNDLEGAITVKEGDLIKGIDQKFSCVAANILADVIIFLLPALPACLKENGLAILSGILDTRLSEVLEAADKLPFDVVETRKQNDWCALLLRYKA
jgi:ribosomal protein L11 methyltransferase